MQDVRAVLYSVANYAYTSILARSPKLACSKCALSQMSRVIFHDLWPVSREKLKISAGSKAEFLLNVGQDALAQTAGCRREIGIVCEELSTIGCSFHAAVEDEGAAVCQL